VLAPERKPLARPAQAQDLDALLEERHAVLHRHRERAEVVGLIADADPEDDAPLGHEVQRDHVLGHVHRMVERQQNDRGADPKTLRAGSHGRGDDEGRGEEPVAILMMLAEEAGVEAARLGELRFGDHFVDAAIEMLTARGAGDRAVEAEFHEPPPWREDVPGRIDDGPRFGQPPSASALAFLRRQRVVCHPELPRTAFMFPIPFRNAASAAL